jgi:hypothetical protein
MESCMATTVDRVTLKTSLFKVSLAIRQGETFDKTVTWKAGSPAAAVDLTGCTARADVRAKPGAAVVLLSMTTENGRIVLGDAAGTIRILLSAAITAEMAVTRGAVWDLEIVYPDDTVRPLLAGSVSVTQEVTRPEGE